MGRLILIKKIRNTSFQHDYAVYKEDSTDKIAYYMRLDSQVKKISLFLTEKFEQPFGVYDMYKAQFERKPNDFSKIINNFAMIKAINAIKNSDFSEDISFRS